MTTLRAKRDSEVFWKWGLRGLFFLLLITAWEVVGRIWSSLLLAPFSSAAVAFVELLGSGELVQALMISNQAMVLGFALSVLVGVPLGLLTGRAGRIERFVDLYLNILLTTPFAAIIPLLMIALGLGLNTRVAVVFVFAFVYVTVNARAGLRNINPSLIEMALSFGASERQIWTHILLPGALPAILVGIRMALARSITGMVLVELLLSSVGVGKLLDLYLATFESGKLFAVIIAIILEAVVLSELAKRLETRLIPWQQDISLE